MGRRRVKELEEYYVGTLDGCSLVEPWRVEVSSKDALRFRLAVKGGTEVEVTFQNIGGVFDFAGKKPTLLEVCAMIEELYALVATDRPVVRKISKQ